MKNFSIIKICALLIKFFTWLVIATTLKQAYDIFTKESITTIDDRYTILFDVAVSVLVILATRFVNMSKKYLYNFNYFYIDKNINENDNLIPNIKIVEKEYEDLPEPKKILISGFFCFISGFACFVACTALLWSRFSYLSSILIIITIPFYIYSFSIFLYIFLLKPQFEHYKKYYNVLILGALVDELRDK